MSRPGFARLEAGNHQSMLLQFDDRDPDYPRSHGSLLPSLAGGLTFLSVWLGVVLAALHFL
jgi:hypothetical protein